MEHMKVIGIQTAPAGRKSSKSCKTANIIPDGKSLGELHEILQPDYRTLHMRHMRHMPFFDVVGVVAGSDAPGHAVQPHHAVTFQGWREPTPRTRQTAAAAHLLPITCTTTQLNPALDSHNNCIHRNYRQHVRPRKRSLQPQGPPTRLPRPSRACILIFTVHSQVAEPTVAQSRKGRSAREGEAGEGAQDLTTFGGLQLTSARHRL